MKQIVPILIGAFSLIAGVAIAREPTRTTLTASPTPSQVGQSVVFTATVDAFGGGIPTGSVAFWDATRRLGSAPLPIVGQGQDTLAAGDTHSCALTHAGGVSCWGANALGDGTSGVRAVPGLVRGFSSGAIAAAAGRYHSCALAQSGRMWCWGTNQRGQIGDGTLAWRRSPVAVQNLPSDVTAMALGGEHSCALMRRGGVKCWGDNRYGQLGDGTRTQRLTPVDVTGLTSGVIAITAGRHSTCALTHAGGVKCWGRNHYGQLGDGTTASRLAPVDVVGLSIGVTAISAGGEHVCARTQSGGAKCWGSNTGGELGVGTLSTREGPVDVAGLSTGVLAVSSGGRHSCALTNTAGVMCWGALLSLVGPDPTPVHINSLAASATAIASGETHSCAMTLSGAKCWGFGGYGQLGGGFAIVHSPPVDVVGFIGLARARAQLTTTTLGAGAHNVEARYPRNERHFPSAGTLTHIVR